jgi:hypothetical protein
MLFLIFKLKIKIILCYIEIGYISYYMLMIYDLSNIMYHNIVTLCPNESFILLKGPSRTFLFEF